MGLRVAFHTKAQTFRNYLSKFADPRTRSWDFDTVDVAARAAKKAKTIPRADPDAVTKRVRIH